MGIPMSLLPMKMGMVIVWFGNGNCYTGTGGKGNQQPFPTDIASIVYTLCCCRVANCPSITLVSLLPSLQRKRNGYALQCYTSRSWQVSSLFYTPHVRELAACGGNYG